MFEEFMTKIYPKLSVKLVLKAKKMFAILLDPRLRVLAVSLASLVVSLTMLLAGTMLVSRSRHVSENIGYRVYQLYGRGCCKESGTYCQMFLGLRRSSRN